MKKISTFKCFLIISAILLWSCQSRQNDISSELYYKDIIPSGDISISLCEIDLKKVEISKIPSSYVGYIRIFGDSIYFIDIPFSRIFAFDKNGTYAGMRLGPGKGPNEYYGGIIEEVFKTTDGNYIIIGPSWDLHYFDSNWAFMQMKRLDWRVVISDGERENNPQPDMPGIYDLALDAGNIRGQLLDNYLYMEVYSEHPRFNMVESRDYYRRGRLAARINYNTAIVEEYLGVRSPVYENYEYIGHLSRFNHFIDSHNQHIYLSFPPDSVIYLCDKNLIPIKAFGRPGKDMDTEYTQYSGDDFYHFREILWEELFTKGYYSGLEHVEQRDILFRSYSKSIESYFDGLQIYQGQTLIADLEVPKGFRVKGYIDTYFISNAFSDPENKLAYFYKFKL